MVGRPALARTDVALSVAAPRPRSIGPSAGRDNEVAGSLEPAARLALQLTCNRVLIADLT